MPRAGMLLFWIVAFHMFIGALQAYAFGNRWTGLGLVLAIIVLRVVFEGACALFDIRALLTEQRDRQRAAPRTTP